MSRWAVPARHCRQGGKSEHGADLLDPVNASSIPDLQRLANLDCYVLKLWPTRAEKFRYVWAGEGLTVKTLYIDLCI